MRDSAAWIRGDLPALTVLVLGVSLFHGRGILPGQTFLPVDLANNSLPWLSGPPEPLQNWLISDPLLQFYPFLVHAVGAIQQGSWPLWNPNLFLGHPVVADPLGQPFYPAYLGLGLLFGPARGLALGLWLHAVLAALLTYGLLRTISCRLPAAVLGAFTYGLSGYMVTWFETTFWISTLSWLPGILWAFEAAVRRRSLKPALLGAVALALAILGGQLSFAATFLLFLGLYALGRTGELALRGEDAYLRPLGVLIAIAGLGSLLGAIQIVPFVEFLGLSHRAALSGLTDPLPLQQLITVIVPSFYGNPASIGSYWGELNFSEGTIYAGLPALLLACVAPFAVRRFFVSYLALVAVVVLFVALGGPGAKGLAVLPGLQYGSLHRFVFLLPMLVALLAATSLSQPMAPVRAVVVAGSMMAAAPVLAVPLNWGQAQDHWQELKGPVLQAAGLLVAAVLLLLLRARFPKGGRWAEGALVVLVFADLFSFGHRFNPAGPIARLMPPTPAIEYLRAHAGLDRVVAYQLADQLLFGPNLLSTYGIAEGGGYSSLAPARFQQLVAVADPKENASGIGRYLRMNGNIVFFNRPSPRLLDVLQVAYVVSPVRLADPDLQEVYQGEVYVYERRPPPRAYVVYAAEHTPDESRVIRRLLDAAFDLRNAVLVGDLLDLPAQTEISANPATIVAYRDTRVVVEATAAQLGLLVLADQFHPGWEAYLDGQPTPVYRVNHLLRGILLPPGEHQIVFRFAPQSVRVGGGLSLSGLALLVLLAALPRRYTRPKGWPSIVSRQQEGGRVSDPPPALR